MFRRAQLSAFAFRWRPTAMDPCRRAADPAEGQRVYQRTGGGRCAV